MPVKGHTMIVLATLSGVWNLGCLKSSIIPPPAAISRAPSVITAQPTMPVFPTQPVVPSINPWKPSVAERDWKYIVIHHTASNQGSVESIHETHLQRKDKSGNPWLGIGYHFVIGNGNGMGDGEIQSTFRWREQLHGAHAGMTEYNQHGIGIVLVGNFEEEHPSPAQIASVKKLVALLKTEYGLTSNNVVGHGEVKATACPGKYFPLVEISRSSAFPAFTHIHSTPVKNVLADIKGSNQ